MRSKKVYFQEVKPMKINIATVATINQDSFLVFANKNSLILFSLGHLLLQW